MKILFVNTSDINGGAARASYRLHRALLNADIDSRMLVQTKASDDPTVIGPETKIGKGLGRVRPTLDQLPLQRYPQWRKKPFHPAWLPFSGVLRKISEVDPDIVHLHWIAGGFVRIEQLAKIGKPMVWSLHDMWAFTGGCHYDDGCGKYASACGKCPVLKSAKEKDLSSRIFARKQKQYSKISQLTVNGLSSWLAECAKQSHLFRNRVVVNLPNPIDIERFKPVAKQQAKDILGLPHDKKHILFGAMNATGDERKGFLELSKALSCLSADDIELAVFGSSEPQSPPQFPFPVRYLGRLHDDISLRILYSAADVMVVPSKQEAFGQTATEAMACGTPVVAFAATGLLDILDHQENGYLARPFESKDLAHGIKFCLNRSESLKMSENARNKVLELLDSKTVAKRYIELYRSKINENQ
ncbi:MAG: glycosyltransferase family 4 protein [Desulfovermiculus sp.]|nr:glycosyltransferase family 4 protein [Desulfovermiculus sp.]